MISIIVLATGLSCSTVGTTTVCTEVEVTEAIRNQQRYALTRVCMARVQANDRDKYPGGIVQLIKDCRTEAEIKIRDNAMRNHDQNGVQSR
jgi:hypothetical protein